MTVAKQTETERVGSLGLKLVAEVDLNSLMLGKNAIVELWEAGVLSPLAYIHFAILYERKADRGDNVGNELLGTVKLNLDAFIERWVGNGTADRPFKMLKRKQVLMAIATLEEKGLLDITTSVLQLSLDLGGDRG
jgi:hypothetical protein